MEDSLLDLVNGKIVASEHCYILKPLKAIIDAYPDDHVTVFEYIFYMGCKNPMKNPYFNTPEDEVEQEILDAIDLKVSLDETIILNALQFYKRRQETPLSRAHDGISYMLDNVAQHMKTAKISDGKDGNLTALISTAVKFEDLRKSFKGSYKDLYDERRGRNRGGGESSYDEEM